LPQEPESYVHRIGRTARAGGEGIAISFCDQSERGLLRDIERIIRMKIEVVPHDLPDLTPEQLKAAEERRQPHGRSHNHGGHGKPRGAGGGHKGHGASGGENAGNPHAPKKRNGSRPHWKRNNDRKRGSAA
jgi:ATP-dependent RNA helicase RhlE